MDRSGLNNSNGNGFKKNGIYTTNGNTNNGSTNGSSHNKPIVLNESSNNGNGSSPSWIKNGSSCLKSISASTTNNGNTTANNTNGNANGNWEKGIWSIGLINVKYKYLTGETFGYKINSNGLSLKKKQIWTIEPGAPEAMNGTSIDGSGSASIICLRSHLNKYLAVDQYGNVTADSDEAVYGSQFEIYIKNDASGKWALRNLSRGYYLGADGDKLICTAKIPSESEYWYIHLAARPQVTLKSVGRKRFAQIANNSPSSQEGSSNGCGNGSGSASGDEIHVDSNIPWGIGTLFTLEFHSGLYALHAANNKYLARQGKLIETMDKDCVYSIEYYNGQMALKDGAGLYLAPIGSKAVLKTRSHTVSKDELFILQDSPPQASFMAALNCRYVSVKQGVDVTANQDEISNNEIFQLEFEPVTARWWIRSMGDKYWTLESNGGIQACSETKTSNALFEIHWNCNSSEAVDGAGGCMWLRAANGKYISIKRNGHLYANLDTINNTGNGTDEAGDASQFYFHLINRPILVLKCDQGFIGYKNPNGGNGGGKLECNKVQYETIQVVQGSRGLVYLKGAKGQYLNFFGDEPIIDGGAGDKPPGFYIELREPSRLAIKVAATGGGKSGGVVGYLNADKNGNFRIGNDGADKATKWEF